MATVKGIPSEFKLLIASATGKHLEVEAKEVYIETDDGDLGVLPGHQPEFYSIGAGYIRCRTVDGDDIEKLLFNGFVQIEPDVVRVGVQDIFETGEVDISAVEKEIEELKSRLESLTEDEEETRHKLESEIKMRETLKKKAR